MHSRVDTKLPVNRFTLLTFNLSSKFHSTVAPLHGVAYTNVYTLRFQLIFSCLHYNYAVLCSMGGGRSAPNINVSTPCLVFISEIVWARNFTLDGSL